jgi:hypothetical protein
MHSYEGGHVSLPGHYYQSSIFNPRSSLTAATHLPHQPFQFPSFVSSS